MAELVAPSREGIERAARLLRAGGVVGMPTETVYGLAGVVFETEALARIFSAKERPTFDPLIVHVSRAQVDSARPLESLAALGLVDLARLSELARERASALARSFWPGPLTIVLAKDARVPDLATSGLPTVGLRMPRHPAAQALIDATGAPLAAPSANRFGRVSPTSAAHVVAELGDRIELVVDGGACEVGLESTVVSVRDDGSVRVLRPGGVSREALERALGAEVALADAPYSETGAQAAPGMLASHYAPRATVRVLAKPVSEHSDAELSGLAGGPRNVGLLLMRDDRAAPPRLARVAGLDVVSQALSRDGRIEEIARNLFAGLRRLDSAGVALILTEPAPALEGLGHAIADRLKRASAPRP